MVKCHIPICNYDVLLNVLNDVQAGKAHYIIYPRDIRNHVKIALEKLNIPPAKCRGIVFTFKRRRLEGDTTWFTFSLSGSNWYVTAIGRDYIRWSGNYKIELTETAKEYILSRLEKF
jgi:hypothetical protein